MFEVSLPASVRSNILALQRVTSLMEGTQLRLATGKRVNSAFDDPVRFFAASALTTRANGLNSLLDSVANAYKTVESANSSLEALTSLVQSAQSIATQAEASPATTSVWTGTVAGLTATSAITTSAGTDTITVGDGTGTTVTATSSGGFITIQQILDAVNNSGTLKVKAELTTDGRLQLQATGTNVIARGGLASSTEKGQIGFSDGTPAAGTLSAARTTLAAQYDQIRSQIDQLAADSAYNGVNLLTGGNLVVKFNAAGTTSFSVTGATLDAAGLGITASTNGFQTDKDVHDAMTKLTTALNTLSAQAANFNSNLTVIQTREDFMKGMIETLEAGADDLVLADINEESAALMVLQTQQQLISTALSFAAQSNSSFLRLFQ